MTRCPRPGDAASTSLQQTLESSSSWEPSLQNSAEFLSPLGICPAPELGSQFSVHARPLISLFIPVVTLSAGELGAD